MATSEPLTGATVYAQTDQALGGAQMGDVVNDLASFTVPRFSTTAARDTAYTNWKNAGHTMVDGMVCHAAGILYRYLSGSWRAMWVDYSMTRVLFTNTAKVDPDMAILTISIPSVPVASRVVITATGKTGFASGDATVSWDYDTIPSGATNVIEDTTEHVLAPSGEWASLTHTLSMDLPTNTAAAPRLVVRATTGVYNRGGVTWYRGPIV